MTAYDQERFDDLADELARVREELDVEREAHACTRQELSEAQAKLATLFPALALPPLPYRPPGGAQ